MLTIVRDGSTLFFGSSRVGIWKKGAMTEGSFVSFFRFLGLGCCGETERWLNVVWKVCSRSTGGGVMGGDGLFGRGALKYSEGRE